MNRPNNGTYSELRCEAADILGIYQEEREDGPEKY